MFVERAGRKTGIGLWQERCDIDVSAIRLDPHGWGCERCISVSKGMKSNQGHLCCGDIGR